MANVTATDRMKDDPRFDTAGVTLGVDGDLVRMKMIRLWSWQTEHYTPESPTYVVSRVALVGVFRRADAPEALVAADLAEVRDGGFYIKGTEGVIEWLWKKKAAGQKGRAEQVKRGSARAHPGHTPGTNQGGDQVVTGPCDPRSEIRDPIPEGEEESHPAVPAGLFPADRPTRKPDPAADLAVHAAAEISRVSGRRFGPSKAVIGLCRALVRAGHGPAEVTLVAEHKAREWLGGKLADRVCPATLLAASNFANYLDEARAGPPTARAVPATSVRPPPSRPLTLEDAR